MSLSTRMIRAWLYVTVGGNCHCTGLERGLREVAWQVGCLVPGSMARLPCMEAFFRQGERIREYVL